MCYDQVLMALSLVSFCLVFALLLMQTLVVISNATFLLSCDYCLLKTAEATTGYYERLLPQVLRSTYYGVRLRIVDSSFSSFPVLFVFIFYSDAH